jgi:hypothetical protein
MQREDEDKQLIRKRREEVALQKQIGNLGWEELKPPIQRGFIRYFVLRGDVARVKEASFFQKILDKINTRQWSHRKDFKKKVRRFGKKVLKVRDQNLDDVFERDFCRKFTEAERLYFYEQWIQGRKKNELIKVYRFSEPWRFVLKVQPNMITKIRVKDLDLERKVAEVTRFFTYERRERLWRMLGKSYHWKSRPDDELSNPLYNKSLSAILDEHWPEPQMKVTSKNPRQYRGFCFYYEASHVSLPFNFLTLLSFLCRVFSTIFLFPAPSRGPT